MTLAKVNEDQARSVVNTCKSQQLYDIGLHCIKCCFIAPEKYCTCMTFLGPSPQPSAKVQSSFEFRSMSNCSCLSIDNYLTTRDWQLLRGRGSPCCQLRLAQYEANGKPCFSSAWYQPTQHKGAVKQAQLNKLATRQHQNSSKFVRKSGVHAAEGEQRTVLETTQEQIFAPDYCIFTDFSNFTK